MIAKILVARRNVKSIFKNSVSVIDCDFDLYGSELKN